LRISQVSEIERRYSSFKKTCEILTPTLKRLANVADLDKWDVRILSASIGHVEYFEEIQLQFEKKFLKGLEKHYFSKPEHDTIKIAFSYNASARLLRAKFLEMDNVLEPTKKLQDMFDSYISILLDIFKDKEEFLVFKSTTLIRKGTFYNDSVLIENAFEFLKSKRKTETYNMLRIEFMDYYSYINIDIIKEKLNLLTGKNIREKRLAYGMTQEDLANILGIDPGTISHVERGARGLSIYHLIKAANYFGMQLEVLMGIKLDDSKNHEDPKLLQLIFHFNRLTESEKDYSIQMLKGLPELNNHRKDTPFEIIRLGDTE